MNAGNPYNILIKSLVTVVVQVFTRTNIMDGIKMKHGLDIDYSF